jgi:hypothetical protein
VAKRKISSLNLPRLEPQSSSPQPGLAELSDFSSFESKSGSGRCKNDEKGNLSKGTAQEFDWA